MPLGVTGVTGFTGVMGLTTTSVRTAIGADFFGSVNFGIITEGIDKITGATLGACCTGAGVDEPSIEIAIMLAAENPIMDVMINPFVVKNEGFECCCISSRLPIRSRTLSSDKMGSSLRAAAKKSSRLFFVGFILIKTIIFPSRTDALLPAY